VFRRRSPDAVDLLDQADQEQEEPEAQPRRGYTAPKDKPTPKRSDAAANRRQPYKAPADRKEAAKQLRSQGRSQGGVGREDRQEKMAAMRRGEEWALPPKDRGPVRKLARDVVDSRRSVSEYYMYSIILIIGLIFVPAARVALDFVLLVIIMVLVAEGYYVNKKVKRLAAERYPGKSTRGAGLYAAMRGTQLRKLRVPQPAVNRGDEI
jgi:Protein of unknown function (DUF3043)